MIDPILRTRVIPRALALAIAAVAVPAVAPAAYAQTGGGKAGTGTPQNQPDTAWMQQAAQDGIAEVQLGRTAVQKARDDRVKQFAQHMIDDHTKANAELEKIAASQNLVLPKTPNEQSQQAMRKIQGLQGDAFDQAYAEHMVEDHQKAVRLFETMEAKGGSSELRTFAGRTLPTLREHLKMAETLRAQMSASTSGTGRRASR